MENVDLKKVDFCYLFFHLLMPLLSIGFPLALLLTSSFNSIDDTWKKVLLGIIALVRFVVLMLKITLLRDKKAFRTVYYSIVFTIIPFALVIEFISLFDPIFMICEILICVLDFTQECFSLRYSKANQIASSENA